MRRQYSQKASAGAYLASHIHSINSLEEKSQESKAIKNQVRCLAAMIYYPQQFADYYSCTKQHEGSTSDDCAEQEKSLKRLMKNTSDLDAKVNTLSGPVEIDDLYEELSRCEGSTNQCSSKFYESYYDRASKAYGTTELENIVPKMSTVKLGIFDD
eukprot:TRINITY_DN297_c0_g1_i1.p1 TRINITY_DN297_c0_g1~~TRINITY_DN297_c0_g1_i1.p1  ORF type:complete len:156 (+),score=22.65 TRINITY_DN297_c0_g1_i1:50-517(+)